MDDLAEFDGSVAVFTVPQVIAATSRVTAKQVARFQVFGRPYPWSSPTFGTGVSKKGRRYRFARKDPNLTRWQKQVRSAAKLVFGNAEPSRDLACLDVRFVFETTETEKWGYPVDPKFRWDKTRNQWRKVGRHADTTNLFKAVEDALNGVAYVDDTQVRLTHALCVWGEKAGVQIAVIGVAGGEEKREKNAEV